MGTLMGQTDDKTSWPKQQECRLDSARCSCQVQVGLTHH